MSNKRKRLSLAECNSIISYESRMKALYKNGFLSLKEYNRKMREFEGEVESKGRQESMYKARIKQEREESQYDRQVDLSLDSLHDSLDSFWERSLSDISENYGNMRPDLI